MKVIYYVAATLDGYIAQANGSVAWLEQLDIDPNTTGYDECFNTVDALLMGRHTYDFVFEHGQWPYGVKPAWVCTRRDVPHLEGANLQPGRDLAAAIAAAERREVKTLWVVGGGKLVASLISQQQLTHLSVAVMPILLGEGVPLVHALPEPCTLRQESARSMPGFTQIEYRIHYTVYIEALKPNS